MHMNRLIPALLLGFGLTAACDPEGVDGEPGDISLRPGTGSQGGVWLNTSAIGNHAFSELDLKKGNHDGVRLTRVLLKRPNNVWLELDRVWAENGEIRGIKGSSSYTGVQLVGSRWELSLVSGATETPAVMWISSAANAAGSWRYNFQHDDGNGGVASLCEPDGNGNVTAIPLSDLTVNATTGDMDTRQNTLYFACGSGALGKAVQWGFLPWQIGVPEFEAIVRVVRADYCGDGVSWTAPGNTMQLKDVWGVSNFASASAANEALWDDGGALCLTQSRSAGVTAVTCGGVPLPACASNISLTGSSGALAWTKVAPL